MAAAGAVSHGGHNGLYYSRSKTIALPKAEVSRLRGGVRSLNRRGQRPLVSADSFGFLFVATGDESLTPQRAFRSPFGNLRGRPLDAKLLMQHIFYSFLNDYKDAVRRSAEGDRKALCSPPQRRNPFAIYQKR